jgi:hypothetical protein
MSKLVLSGDISGSVTLDAPAVSGTTTLTLPTTSGTIVTTASGQTLNSPTIATPTITGQATIPTINLTGGQITFPATQSASADANTLDDYEEGTWTPSITGSVSNPTVGYVGRSGMYIKIGKFVWCYFDVLLSSTSGGSGTIVLSGLPFSSNGGSAIIGYAQSFTSFAPRGGLLSGQSVLLTIQDSATTQSYSSIGQLTNSSYLIGNIVYQSTA